ncbi:MAG: hypothetical protein GXP41_02440 [Chloroflexi bacterium]|nr:hypothetical protein [Chloroflexota bacterium]
MTAQHFTPLCADIDRELNNLKRLTAESETLLDRARQQVTFLELRTAGSVLHDFYSGTEKVFRRIALEVDGSLPAGPDWHLQLLLRMASPLRDARPAVINEDLKNRLGEYLRFRHLIRNIYGFELQWDRCHDLLYDLPDLFSDLSSQLQRFQQFLLSVE